MIQRRRLLGAGLGSLALTAVAQPGDPLAPLRAGGVVFAMRHALAPGTFDPPGFTLADCRSQRNLSDEGRAQARRIGERLKAAALRPARVRSSPWCRCLDTAELAFGSAERWAALGSPAGSNEATNADHLAELRRALTTASAQAGRFEVWVTHNFVLSALAGSSASVGEGLLLRRGAQGAVEVLGRLDLS
jgi:phosphohistidine phosphatase SixA